ncbi:hypothetical protein F4X86_00045 [Candidatus Saccharibacteria bacterium]|nr:hypothetical protein [Candidatus Saccharibacteria bacterium]
MNKPYLGEFINKSRLGSKTWFAAVALTGILLITGAGMIALGASHEAAKVTRLVISIEQSGLTITARAIGAYTQSEPADFNVTAWKQKLVNVGDYCNEESFSGDSPNNPAINRSYAPTFQFTIPSTDQEAFRNKWLCLAAIDETGLIQYASYGINLNDPAISVKKTEATIFQSAILRTSANRNIDLRVGRVTGYQYGQATKLSAGRVGSVCEQLFNNVYADTQLEGYSERGINMRIVFAGGHITSVLHEKSKYDYKYCFEATDRDGNQAYVDFEDNEYNYDPITDTYSNIDVIEAYSTSFWHPHTKLEARLINTSGNVSWRVSYPSHDSAGICAPEYLETAGFEIWPAGGFKEIPATTERVDESRTGYYRIDKGAVRNFVVTAPQEWQDMLEEKYADLRSRPVAYFYCIHAVDEIGNDYYRPYRVLYWDPY